MANSSDVKIVVLGVGGGGSNAINNMIQDSRNDDKLKFVVVNTDQQDIVKSIAQNKILISTKNKKGEGLGAGAKPEVGTDAAENSIDEIRKVLEGADICFIAAGLGGGTGSGAAHVIAKCAKEELDITTVAVVTRPFKWEGKHRLKNAMAALENLKQHTDALIEIPNDKILSISDKKTTVTDAFKFADSVLKDGVLGITDLITETGLINLDFADVQTIVKNAGIAHMGIGTYKATGDESNKVAKALEKAIQSDLLETNIKGARRIMINYVGAEDLEMLDISEANDIVYELVDEDVNLIWGNAIDKSLQEGEVKVTVIAADFNNECTATNESIVSELQSNRQENNMGSNAFVNSNLIGNTNAPQGYVSSALQNHNAPQGYVNSTLQNHNADALQNQDSVIRNNENVGSSNTGFSNVPKSFDASAFKSRFARR